MGGSVSAPAPDPALMDAQIKSLDAQTDIGRRTLANAEALQPMQREQMQFGLDAGKKAYEQTQADREYALGKRDQYDKALQGVMDDSAKFDEATRRQELMQEAKADISSQFSAAQDQQTRGLNRAGVMPGSGKALMMQQQGELAEAAAKSRAGLMVSEAAKKEGLQLRGQNVAMLSGAPAMAASLTPAGANLGVMGLDTANVGAAGMNAGFTEAGKAIGDAGKMAGDMWSSANKLYTSAAADNDKAQGEMIGSAVGLAGRAGYSGYKNYGWNGSAFDRSRTGPNQNNGW